jgi:hypothetical protein
MQDLPGPTIENVTVTASRLPDWILIAAIAALIVVVNLKVKS